ncbi:hypothetical protein, partial [Frankia sp. AgKG'84/4]|uniref:hypothetical protein n=1 Tax=Frankia sp. AgKG'84/4 TaxID=573490 RepID=UPI00202A7C96
MTTSTAAAGVPAAGGTPWARHGRWILAGRADDAVLAGVGDGRGSGRWELAVDDGVITRLRP